MAIPTNSPSLLTAGPPLLPLLIAASICIAKRDSLLQAYFVYSIREITPVVVEIALPPIG